MEALTKAIAILNTGGMARCHDAFDAIEGLEKLRQWHEDTKHVLGRLIGDPLDPNIGWRGFAKTSNEHFRCEYCGVENLDATAMEHLETCPVPRAVNLLKDWPK
jgi:hypothetical protein